MEGTLDPSIVKLFLSGGHYKLAATFLLIQVVIIPLTLFLWKQWQANERRHSEQLAEATKKAVDAERQVTKLIRDQQYRELEQRISQVEKDACHEIAQLKLSVDALGKTIKRKRTRKGS
jgi:uncharacterized protein HemX